MELDLLKRFYFEMLRIRRVEEKIAELYPMGEMRCPVHLCIGQEAVAVGVSLALAPGDRSFGNHRSHGHYLAKGGDLKAMLAELYGRAAGCARGRGGSMHLVDAAAGFLGAPSILASSIPIAVGAAFASVLRGEPRVTAVFLGDGAVEEGAFYEALNFAALKGLPVVFVCENNLYSVYSPLSVRQPAGRELAALASGIGVEGHRDDGNDVLAVHRLAAAAVAKARGGGGPTFLEFETRRWREHCGPNFDDDLGHRPEAESQERSGRCPILRLADRLLSSGAIDRPEIERMEERVRDEIEEALRFARESPFPPAEDLLKDVCSARTSDPQELPIPGALHPCPGR